VAVGEGYNSIRGLIFTSADGITWTEQNSPSYNPLFDVYCKDTQCVAVGSMGTILTSGVLTPVNAACGNDNGKSLLVTPSDLCTLGTASLVTGTGPWSWTCSGAYTGKSASCGASIQKFGLTVTVPVGTGKGDVTADSISDDASPVSIFCPKSSCSAFYNAGRIIRLVATPDPVSFFSSWDGYCVADPCDIEMSGPKYVTANFTRDFFFRIAGSGLYDNFIDNLLLSASSGDEIRMLSTSTTVNSLVLNKPISLTGGWKALHQSLAVDPTILTGTITVEDTDTGIKNTIIRGSISVKSGKLVVEGVTVSPSP